MPAKNRDEHNRWRNRQVAFRLAREEAEQLDIAVQLSGLTKQDYIIRCLLDRKVVIQGNPRVYKALRNQLAAVLAELQRIETDAELRPELVETIQMITTIMGGMKEGCAHD